LEIKDGAHRIFKVAFMLFTTIGIIFSLMLFFGAEYISNSVLANPGVKYTLMALSPAIIFVAMTAVVRGYFVGMQNMTEYSKAQVLEQIVNSIFSIIFVIMLLRKNTRNNGSRIYTCNYTCNFCIFLLLN
jgi:stage V sporulation protein B